MADFLQHPSFATILVNSLPCCLIIVDDKGRVQTANRHLERTLGVCNKSINGKSIGEALGCICAEKNTDNCSHSEYCKACDARNLCRAATNNNQVQKTRTYLQIKNNGRVRDADLVISAVPFAFNNQRFSYLVIEDVPGPHPAAVPAPRKGVGPIVGEHPKMKELFRTIRQVSRTAITLLVQGETGTGKELVAQAIHTHSPRASKNFVPVNCGALPEGLLKTELFGHVKGAFTGAISDKKGRFELADRGTLFLDEVGELSPGMQVQFLRVLQDGIFHPVGSEKPYRADIRLISATNKDLESEVAAGRFRKDLYYRLSAMPISVPPLRERRSDIPLLADHFLTHYGKKFFGKRARLSSEAVAILMAYDWPGNVRELMNAIQFARSQMSGQPD